MLANIRCVLSLSTLYRCLDILYTRHQWIGNQLVPAVLQWLSCHRESGQIPIRLLCCILSSRAPNKVGVNIIGMCYEKAGSITRDEAIMLKNLPFILC